MPAIQTINIGSDASADHYKKLMPYNDNVKLLLATWADQRHATRNLAQSVAEDESFLALTGTPTYNAGYVGLQSYNNYITSNTPETEAFTWIAIVKTTEDGLSNATRPVFMGNYNGTSGALLYFLDTSGTKYIRGQFYDGSNTLRTRVVATTAYTGWNMYALVGSTSAITLYDVTNGGSQTLSITGRTVADRDILIGSSYSSAFDGGDMDASLFMILDIAATQPQLVEYQTAINTMLAPKGITI